MSIQLALRTTLPCTVPPGGVAIVLADGRIAPDGVQGPGELRPDPWRKHGRRLEAILFPASSLRLDFDIPDLRSAEEVSLDLHIVLALRISDPVRFLTDVVRDAPRLSQDALGALLRDTLRSGLASALRQRRLAELDADRNLRGWLGAAIERSLRAEADLAGRSGLEVLGVDACDLRCQVLDSKPLPIRLWRKDLGDEVSTTPLSDGERVYVATRHGQVYAFVGADGEPAWPQLVELGVSPGDGLPSVAGGVWGLLARADRAKIAATQIMGLMRQFTRRRGVYDLFSSVPSMMDVGTAPCLHHSLFSAGLLTSQELVTLRGARLWQLLQPAGEARLALSAGDPAWPTAARGASLAGSGGGLGAAGRPCPALSLGRRSARGA